MNRAQQERVARSIEVACEQAAQMFAISVTADGRVQQQLDHDVATQTVLGPWFCCYDASPYVVQEHLEQGAGLTKCVQVFTSLDLGVESVIGVSRNLTG